MIYTFVGYFLNDYKYEWSAGMIYKQFSLFKFLNYFYQNLQNIKLDFNVIINYSFISNMLHNLF